MKDLMANNKQKAVMRVAMPKKSLRVVINMMYVKSFNMKELRANDRINIHMSGKFLCVCFNRSN
jgi:hypothetical protein